MRAANVRDLIRYNVGTAVVGLFKFQLIRV